MNQWVVDYIKSQDGSDHPPAFNRIQAIMDALPDLRDSDVAFFEIMTAGLNEQKELRTALRDKSTASRYAALTRWSRSHLGFADYERMVEAVCQAYREIGA